MFWCYREEEEEEGGKEKETARRRKRGEMSLEKECRSVTDCFT